MPENLPPHNLDCERAILGSMMLDREAVMVATEILSEELFFSGAHKVIFAAANELYRLNIPIDMITIAEKLKEQNQFNGIGGVNTLADLTSFQVSSPQVEQYARIVRSNAQFRMLINTCRRTMEQCYNGANSAETFEQHEKEFYHILGNRHVERETPIGTIVLDAIEKIGALKQKPGGVIGVRTGFTKLDWLTGGWQEGNEYVLAARPSMGKSAVMLHFARFAASKDKVPVAVFSMEMGKMSLGVRMLATASGIDSNLIKRNQLNAEDWGKIQKTMQQFMDTKIFIDDSSGVSLIELKSKCRRMKEQRGIGLVLIDYLGLMDLPRRETQTLSIAEVTKGIKGLAKELSIPIILLTQLNRALEHRDNKRPILPDLRDSGAIEQDADVVIFLYRGGVYDKNIDKEDLEVIVSKQRDGALGTVDLKYQLETGNFYEIDEKHNTPY